MDSLTYDGTKFHIGDKVYFAGAEYEIACFKLFPHGWCIGIYDEPPGRHIDFLNPRGLSLIQRNMKTNQTFQQAIEAAKNGYMISREGWNKKNLFVFFNIPCVVDLGLVPKIVSMPASVKTTLIQRGTHITYQKQACLLYPDGVVEGWSPSFSDAIAEDWMIDEEPWLDFSPSKPEETVGKATPASECNNYQDRVKLEKKTVDDNLFRLEQFLQTEFYQTLPDHDRLLLQRQRDIMHQYSNVLCERIANFPQKPQGDDDNDA